MIFQSTPIFISLIFVSSRGLTKKQSKMTIKWLKNKVKNKAKLKLIGKIAHTEKPLHKKVREERKKKEHIAGRQTEHTQWDSKYDPKDNRNYAECKSTKCSS